MPVPLSGMIATPRKSDLACADSAAATGSGAATTIGAALCAVATILRASGRPDFDAFGAKAEARALLAALLGGSGPAGIARRGHEPLAPELAEKARRWAEARAAGCPLSRLTKRRGFWTLDLAIDEDCLDPRPDSETVVTAALDATSDRDRAVRVLDLGTGSGCLLLAVLAERPHARGLGVDLAPGAVVIAQRNAEALGLAGRASFLCADFADGQAMRAALGGPADLVLANPPYIPADEVDQLDLEVRLHDPLLALLGGADGLDAYRRILPTLPALLTPSGIAVLEHGAAQQEAVAAIAAAAGLEVRRRLIDLGGRPRVVVLAVAGRCERA